MPFSSRYELKVIRRVFHAMATFQREDPFVHVYAANDDTIVHIRQMIYTSNGDQSTPKQAHDGVMMTLMQFRSLMFHLRALDAQFMLATESQLSNAGNIESQDIRIDEKKTEIDDDSIFFDKNIKHKQTNTVAWDELSNILSTIDKPNNIQDISEPSNIQNNATYFPTPIMNQKAVRNELAISYAEEIAILLPSLVHDACKGCKNEIDQTMNGQQHDVCKLPRRKRIDLFTEMALLSIDVNSVHTKVITRLRNRHAMFNEKWVYEDRQSLAAKKTWMHKLKMYILNL